MAASPFIRNIKNLNFINHETRDKSHITGSGVNVVNPICDNWNDNYFKIIGMTKLHKETKRKCPKCKSRFGIFLSTNLYKGLSRVICFNGDCDWNTSIIDWNNTYKRSQFKDEGYI